MDEKINIKDAFAPKRVSLDPSNFLNNLSVAKLDQINNPSVTELSHFVEKNSVMQKMKVDTAAWSLAPSAAAD